MDARCYSCLVKNNGEECKEQLPKHSRMSPLYLSSMRLSRLLRAAVQINIDNASNASSQIPPHQSPIPYRHVLCVMAGQDPPPSI
jgi:hypothetical protein